jgi:hypothetical protein
MDLRMAPRAQCDQVLFLVAARVTSELLVVDLQVPHAAATLAAPAVTFQESPVQLAIDLGIET